MTPPHPPDFAPATQSQLTLFYVKAQDFAGTVNNGFQRFRPVITGFASVTLLLTHAITRGDFTALAIAVEQCKQKRLSELPRYVQ
jgi:hypothetical protein